ncbi:hypothetical protein C1878_05470 [Gordonibacter sp. 28C]|nr:hypothetical protein C1878_05470 [Gordonibacter sp. 28C]
MCSNIVEGSVLAFKGRIRRVLVKGVGALDVRIVYEFVELAKNLNFTETARLLNMSQPTLSKHINSLEKELRLSLFDRSGSSMRLTTAGASLLSYAYKLIEAQIAFDERAKELRVAPSVHLSIGGLVNEEMVTRALSCILAELGPVYGFSFLETKPCRHQLPREILEEGGCDVVFDYMSEHDISDDDELEVVQLGSCPWVALMSSGHHLAQQESIALSQLQGETLIKIEGSHVSDAWRYIEKACHAHGFKPKTRRHYSMKETDLLTTAASIRDDVLIMGTNFTKRVGMGIAPFCVQVPITDDDAFFPISAVYRLDNANPVLEEALEVLRESIDGG